MAKCKSCGTEIVWLTTRRGKHMPVVATSLSTEDRELLGRGDAVAYRQGEHVPHWGDCDDPGLFRK